MNASFFTRRAAGLVVSGIAAAAALVLSGAAGSASAQPSGVSPLNPPANGMRRADSTWHALANATVHVRPGEVLENATVVIRDGRIVSVGKDAPHGAAAGARVWDCTGLHIYAGFIDAHVEVTAPEPDANAPGGHWNARVMPQRSALDGTGVDAATATSLRRLGFAAAAIAPRGGVFRGSSAVVSLAAPASYASADRPPVYRERAYQGVAFDTGGRGRGGDTDISRWSSYPNSQMGAIALIRQTLIDADWQVEARASGAQFAANSLDYLAAPVGAVAERRRRDGQRDAGLGGAAGAGQGAPSGSMGVMQPVDQGDQEKRQDGTRGGGDGMFGGETYRPGRDRAQEGEAQRGRGEANRTLPMAEEREKGAQERQGSREGDDALTALRGNGGVLPLLFDSDDELEALRAAKIAREFEREAMILGSGYEFRRLEAIAADGLPIVLPLRYPRTPDVAGVGKADSVELADLMSWEQAPTNARRLDAAGVKIALTTSKLRNRNEFEANLTRAIKHGLSSERALAMLTTQPAELLGVSDRLGTVEAGKVANLIVADGPLLIGFAGGEKKEEGEGDAGSKEDGEGAGEDSKEKDAKENGAGGDRGGDDAETPKRGKIRDVWIDGFRHEISAAPVRDHVGRWQVIEIDGKRLDPAAPDAVTFTITRENRITYKREGKETRATNVRVSENRIDYTIDGSMFGIDAMLLDTAVVEGDMMHGTTPMPDGSLHRWSARRLEDEAPAAAGDGGQKPEEAPDAEAPAAPDGGFAGVWRVEMPATPDAGATVEIGADNSVRVNVGGQSLVGRDILIEGNSVSFRLDGTLLGMEGMIAVSGSRQGDSMSGTADLPDEGETAWTAIREGAQDAAPARPRRGVAGRAGPGAAAEARGGERRDPETVEREAISAIPENYGYPFGPYMVQAMPEQKPVLLVNATIWTSADDGVIENGWMFIKDGKISSIGSGSGPSRSGDMEVIDLRGRHIAPGIIDAHSHTGISRGVNESGQAVTSEVRIQDVTNPDAISWYRQLASGVTAVNNLHGSANAIGGQSQTNKIRWGARHPDDMHLEGAKPGIKFALGENVKQSNSGDRNTARYPQTRMGVETLIRDRFKAAAEYKRRRDGETERRSGSIGSMNDSLPVRRDLELEALAEILAGERLVHCHSYRQDEILMLCRVAGEFGFKIGTFQHILEGYKVADEIAKHAIGASAFSDWWAFKVEVQDAIPQGGPIMWEEGVVVSFNSDSDELARRMNGEAAKAVKYSSPERPIDDAEALKFITINPAIQLGVADRIGSLEVGKDADFAIWSGSPLSSMSRCMATYVDGRQLFSLEDDAEHRKTIQRERQRLIQKILAEHRRPGAAPGRGVGEGERRRPTELTARQSMMRDYYLDLINRGIDPTAARPGDCGCDELDLLHWHD